MDDFLMLDTTGDGLIDTYGYTDEYGNINIMHDYDYNGEYEVVEIYTNFNEYGEAQSCIVGFDTDNNGTLDSFMATTVDDYGNVVEYAEAYDYDQDGSIDMEKDFTDTNHDGAFDMVTTTHYGNPGEEQAFRIDIAYDENGDQQLDYSLHMTGIDVDHDGTPDYVHYSLTDPDGNVIDETDLTYQEYLYYNELDYTTVAATNGTYYGQYDINGDDTQVSGTPSEDMEYWEYQGQTQRCAIYAQKFAIEAITGEELDIDEMVALAQENGWFDETTGTYTLNMDKMLDYYGVEHDMSFDNSIDDLEAALNNDQKVIVNLDSGQIWYDDPNNIFSPETRPDHAVEVIGIDRTDPENPMVILNDSGTPNGQGELVPLDVFENAWNSGDSLMIVCYA